MRKKKEKTTPVKHIPVSLELLTYCGFQKQMPKIQVSDNCLVAHMQVCPPGYKSRTEKPQVSPSAATQQEPCPRTAQKNSVSFRGLCPKIIMPMPCSCSCCP